jgi:hypothetical protein
MVDTTAPPHFSATTVVSVGIRLYNAGDRAITSPARVYVGTGALSGGSASGQLSLSNGCVVGGSLCAQAVDADALVPQPMWKFDTVLTNRVPSVLRSRHLSGTRELAIHVSSNTTVFQIPLRAVAQAVPPVSTIPPDTIPKWVHADSNFVAGGAVRNLLVVIFRQGTSAAKRQVVIDSVDGLVVGGRHLASRGGDGFYYIWVPNASTEKAIRALAAKIRRLPQVEGAAPEMPAFPAYLRPSDGTGWQAWQNGRDNYGSEQNWFLENDNAPLAWGCSTGDTSVHIGIVDHRFDATEIASNVIYFNSTYAQYASDTVLHHGTFVANIISAKGNDGVGMTGMMWRSGLMLWDFGTSMFSITDVTVGMDSLAVHGAQIINLSEQTFYLD